LISFIALETILSRQFRPPFLDRPMIAREIVTSRANPLVKRLRALLGDSARSGLAVLEGFKLVEEALDAGIEIVECAVAPDVPDGRHAALVARLEGGGAAVRILAPDVLGALAEAETSQGIVAIARRPAFDEGRIFHGTPLIVVGVGIQNPGNVGALLRTAEAAGATGAYFTSESADPMSWKALRGSMGSAFRVPHVSGLGAADMFARLAAHGVTTIATVAAGGERYDAMDLAGPVAMLFGNEGAGLPAELAERAGRRVAIPMAQPVESLNVAVAAGILLFEAARQRRR
jgi:RNA methyltransferase, TrmH family